MAVPVMRKAGYDTVMSAGTITAGGTLGILIPPSVMLVVMGPVLRVSVVQLFAAAIVPGLMLALIFLLYTRGRSYLNPQLGPPLPLEERPKSLAPVLDRKSTRLNSITNAHLVCRLLLEKKKTTTTTKD